MNRQTEAPQASINQGYGDPTTLIVTLGLHREGVADPNIESHIELNLLPKRVGGFASEWVQYQDSILLHTEKMS